MCEGDKGDLDTLPKHFIVPEIQVVGQTPLAPRYKPKVTRSPEVEVVQTEWRLLVGFVCVMCVAMSCLGDIPKRPTITPRDNG